MDSRFLLRGERTRDEFEENLRLTEEVDESNLENTRKEEEENLGFTEEDDEATTSKREFKVPLGYRFHPTAVELVEEYLMKKILRQLTWDTIKEINFYQLDPQQIPISEFEGLKYGGEGRAYYFTSEEQKYVEGSRLMPRPFSNGYWKRCGGEIPIHNGFEIIGFKRRFVWEEVPKVEESKWKMTEYSVTPRFMEDLSQTNLENYVVCKVRDMSRYKKHFS
ncbi:NAC domain-containing protein 82-like [Olea europaea var. sylvestris]|uniref:NAC domain-containing 2 n=1 Tax=Olea europaea subsp. europaea TaxID=158383 RepID=A0A8S0R4Z9_OLEEU|nr:NAC domain-containing protein 82-like [Olea europaea var. sylvestris]CAA2973530.1 NAC domain-containing 2 [Olea europaea subsp. europaea]